jgi:NAD+ synthase (glutamine-hydrolysing)
MNNMNFCRVAAANINLKVADCTHNKSKLLEKINEARDKEVEIIAFPELSITGYTCGDLFFQRLLLKESENAVKDIVELTSNMDMLIAIGAPVEFGHKLYNCAVIINRGKIIAVIPKTYLPNYNEFYEQRWFHSGAGIKGHEIDYCGFKAPFGTDVLLKCQNNPDLIVGVEICEDLWSTIPPSSFMSMAGATLILNLSASNDLIGKSQYRRDLVVNQSARCISAYAYASAGYGESTTDLVFGGHCLIAENGKLLEESERYLLQESMIFADIDLDIISHERKKINTFESNNHNEYREVPFLAYRKHGQTQRKYQKQPFVPQDDNEVQKRCEEIFSIQTIGLAKRIQHIGSKSMLIGVSGGLDSTLALLVCVKTCEKLGLDKKTVRAVTMPGFGTTDRTYNNAVGLIESLGVDCREISIEEACRLHFRDIGHDVNVRDVTYENTQARERTQILMDLANMHEGIVVGTGDLSELAMGWATYNGDHMSMYGVNSGIPKTLIRYVVKWVSENQFSGETRKILIDILDTPVSPELLPPDSEGKIAQKTEDLLGPYELHDFFLYHTVRNGMSPSKLFCIAKMTFEDLYTGEYIYDMLRRFYWRFITQQFKRSCLPDGPKVGTVCLSPRGDWRMPSDVSVKLWMEEMDRIKEENA